MLFVELAEVGLDDEPGKFAAGPTTEIRDASGLIVTPGLIDLHTHVYWGGTSLGIDADEEFVVGLIWYGYAKVTPEQRRRPLTEVLTRLP